MIVFRVHKFHINTEHNDFNMRSTIRRRFVACGLSVAVSLALIFVGTANGSSKLNIIHVNDSHSHIEADSKGNYGFARMKTVVDSIRNIP